VLDKLKLGHESMFECVAFSMLCTYDVAKRLISLNPWMDPEPSYEHRIECGAPVRIRANLRAWRDTIRALTCGVAMESREIFANKHLRREGLVNIFATTTDSERSVLAAHLIDLFRKAGYGELMASLPHWTDEEGYPICAITTPTVTDDIDLGAAECSWEPEYLKTIVFTIGTGVTHEFARNRGMSPMQSSTRYVDYAKGKFNGINLIDPAHGRNAAGKPVEMSETARIWLDEAIATCVETYQNLREDGVPAQIAREVLPKCIEADFVLTGTAENWAHFLSLRDAPPAHPHARHAAEAAFALIMPWDEFCAEGYLEQHLNFRLARIWKQVEPTLIGKTTTTTELCSQLVAAMPELTTLSGEAVGFKCDIGCNLVDGVDADTDVILVPELLNPRIHVSTVYSLDAWLQRKIQRHWQRFEGITFCSDELATRLTNLLLQDLTNNDYAFPETQETRRDIRELATRLVDARQATQKEQAVSDDATQTQP
jgi:thymidylate synthase ThyX